MYKAVKNYVSRYESIVKKIAKLASGHAALSKNIDDIEEVSKIQGQNRKGHTAGKNALRKKLTALTMKNASKLALLARQNGNKVLMEEARLKESELNRLTENTFVEKATIIWERVESNLPNLEDQAVTVDTQSSFHEVIKAFNAAISIPRVEISEKSKATQTLKALYQSADSAIEDMDLAAASAKDEMPEFYNGYKAARVLVDTSSGSILIKGSAREQISGKPVGRAIFTFSNAGGLSSNGNGHVVKRTTENGNFLLKSIIPGTYKVVVSKPGYREKEVSVIVNPGEKMDLKVELEKA